MDLEQLEESDVVYYHDKKRWLEDALAPLRIPLAPGMPSYEYVTGVYNTRDFGLPQFRARCYIWG